jgi:glycine/D-amino acid oxidase-like deaminating enzyme
MQRDFIIVGGGLAGISLAVRLLQAGAKPLLFSFQEENGASAIAAGLMNPIVFKRLTKAWRSDEFLADANTFYSKLEEILGSQFYIKPNFYRVHGSEYEQKSWKEMSAETEFSSFLGRAAQDQSAELLNAPFGQSFLLGTSAILSTEFLKSVKNYLQEQGCICEEKLEYDKIRYLSHRVEYKDSTASHIIFCTGAEAALEGPFKGLPFKIAKGEVLTISCKLPDVIFNGKIYGVPLSNGTFKVGSTYSWDNLNNLPTSEGKAEITKHLDNLLKIPYEVLQHQAGLRPTIKDRRPLLGLSKHQPRAGIFNGLGTKGYLMAPLLSLEMSRFLLEGKPLHPETDIARFEF